MKIFKDTENKYLTYVKIGVAVIVFVVLGFFAFTTQVREGSGAIILRFGAPRKVITEAGLYLKLPWPFESVVQFDGRQQYLESNYLETTTKDKRNVILQSYAVWSVKDPLLFYNSVGTAEKADSYIRDQIFSATNSTMGAYELSALVSLDKEKLNTDKIQDEIFEQVKQNCEENYGIMISDVNILRISLPETNLQSVFDQMIADRQKEIDTILAEAERDANKITAEADTQASQIVAQGQIQAAEIKKQTEKEVAAIYAEAQKANVELYKFLLELDALSSSVKENSILIVKADTYPFNLLLKYSKMATTTTSDEVIIQDLNYIMTQLTTEEREEFVSYIYMLLKEAEVN